MPCEIGTKITRTLHGNIATYVCKPDGQVLVGFAAETSDLRTNAASKLDRKRADLIVANDVSAPEVGFEHDTNAVVILVRDGREIEVPLADKREVARAVLEVIESRGEMTL